MGGEVASFPPDAWALVPRVGITGVPKLGQSRGPQILVIGRMQILDMIKHHPF